MGASTKRVSSSVRSASVTRMSTLWVRVSLHLVDAEARAEERFPSVARSRGTGARLAPPEDDGGHRSRREIRPRQVLLHPLYTRWAHSLSPQQGPLGRVAEAARVLLTDDQNDEVRHVLIEVRQEPVLRVQIDQRSSQPGDGHEVRDRGLGDPLPPPGVGFQSAVPAGLDQAGLPGDVLEGIGHAPTLALTGSLLPMDVACGTVRRDRLLALEAPTPVQEDACSGSSRNAPFTVSWPSGS